MAFWNKKINNPHLKLLATCVGVPWDCVCLWSPRGRQLLSKSNPFPAFPGGWEIKTNCYRVLPHTGHLSLVTASSAHLLQSPPSQPKTCCLRRSIWCINLRFMQQRLTTVRLLSVLSQYAHQDILVYESLRLGPGWNSVHLLFSIRVSELLSRCLFGWLSQSDLWGRNCADGPIGELSDSSSSGGVVVASGV